MISEAAKQVDVESHVLRYWEEELDLKIGPARKWDTDIIQMMTSGFFAVLRN